MEEVKLPKYVIYNGQSKMETPKLMKKYGQFVKFYTEINPCSRTIGTTISFNSYQKIPYKITPNKIEVKQKEYFIWERIKNEERTRDTE